MKTFAPLVALASFASIATAAPLNESAVAKRGATDVAKRDTSKWSISTFSGSKRQDAPEDVDGDNNKSC